MHLYKTRSGAVVHNNDSWFFLSEDWDSLINHDALYTHVTKKIGQLIADDHHATLIETELLAPVGSQEVWAAGVTYLRSREARMEESQRSGAASVYDLVYEAERPELFFKSNPSRVAGHGEVVHMRRDSSWNVPEPELTLLLSSSGKIIGYTIGNDMSSRSIEGENPLYLPQAKTYHRSAALGPCILVLQQPLSPDTTISMEIVRSGIELYADSIQINKMKRTHEELAGFLFRECDFPTGVFLMTGTCLVPAGDFTLQIGDIVNIRIASIGLLANTVGVKD